jgi:hypothetical protein
MSQLIANKVAGEIVSYINMSGGGYAQWYVGIASDVERRLFTDHCVRKSGDRWVYQDCGDSMTARSVEEYFVKTLGADGGGGGGDVLTRFVYAYHKAPHTRP